MTFHKNKRKTLRRNKNIDPKIISFSGNAVESEKFNTSWLSPMIKFSTSTSRTDAVPYFVEPSVKIEVMFCICLIVNKFTDAPLILNVSVPNLP